VEIHNIMEDEVARIVNEICDEDKANPVHHYCTAELCRMDAICYVLNRIPQRYVTSGRGMAHAESDLTKNPQLLVDVMALAHEGLRRVSQIQRSYYDQAPPEGAGPEAGPYFNFPTIKGRLFNGVTFEPAKDIDVYLKRDGEQVAMFDPRWQNPYPLAGSTDGTYLFWPQPVTADRTGETQTFEFEISVHADGFEPFHHFFKLEVTADDAYAARARFTTDHALADLYILPE